MQIITSNPNVQTSATQYLDVPEEAMRRAPNVINAKNNTNESPSLLSTAGWSAAATGLFQAKPVWENRERATAAKWFKDGKVYQKANNIKPFVSAGKVVRNIGTGSILAAALTAPTDWLSGKMSEKYQDDKKFNPSHFAAIAAPAAISGTIGTGALMNSMDQMKDSGKIGTKQMIKNSLSSKKIFHATGREMGNVANVLKTKKIGSGLLAAGMLGLSAADPIQYIMNTKKNKEQSKKDKKQYIKKEASVKSATSKLRTKAKDYIERRRLLGLGIMATGTYLGAKNFIEDKKKKINDHANKRYEKYQHLFGEPGLLT